MKNQNQFTEFIKKNIYGKKIVIGMGAGSISNWIKELRNQIMMKINKLEQFFKKY